MLFHELNKDVMPEVGSNWYANMGKAVQMTYELYYNRGLWEKEGLRNEETLLAVADKVLDSERMKTEQTVFDEHLTEVKFRETVREQVRTGFGFLKEADLLDKPLQSEWGWRATYRGFRMYGMIDFLLKEADGVRIFDGKGYQKQNADPRQLMYYALILVASGHVVKEAAFIYWKHGITPVDVTSEALREFADSEEFAEAVGVFRLLRNGASKAEMPTKPTRDHCHFCPWKFSCQDSTYKRGEVEREGSFKEIETGLEG